MPSVAGTLGHNLEWKGKFPQGRQSEGHSQKIQVPHFTRPWTYLYMWTGKLWLSVHLVSAPGLKTWVLGYTWCDPGMSMSLRENVGFLLSE